MLITAGLLVLFVGSASSVSMALGLGLLIGLFANGCVAGLYAFSPIVYDASVRTTGVGWAIGIGRIGAILSPIAAGFLLDGGWQPLHLYGVFATVFVLAAGCLLLLKPGATQVQPTLSPARTGP
jgi:MFS family permease